MNLTPNFTLEELTFSSTAERLIIDNRPPPPVIDHLRILANGLEAIRVLLGQVPLHIDSGFRCPALNKAVCGAPNSAHLDGYAADFICPTFGSPLAIVARIKGAYIDFDQCIQEGTWVHISFDPKARKQLLTARFGPNGTSYTQGA